MMRTWLKSCHVELSMRVIIKQRQTVYVEKLTALCFIPDTLIMQRSFADLTHVLYYNDGLFEVTTQLIINVSHLKINDIELMRVGRE